MTKKPLDALSARIRDAINPPKKRQDATAKILDEVEPLPIVTAISQPEDAPVQNGQGTSRHATRPSELLAPSPEPPVENTLGKMATLAKTEPSPWSKSRVVKSTMVKSARVNTSVNLSTLAKLTRVAELTEVKGDLRVPNTILDSLFPILEPAAALVYLRLFRLSHGYKQDVCVVGLQKLAAATNTSQKTVQRAIENLDRRGLIERVGTNFGGPNKGNHFRVHLPATQAKMTALDKSTTVANLTTLVRKTTVDKTTTVAKMTSNKKDDDYKNENHHQSDSLLNLSTVPEEIGSSTQETTQRKRESASDLVTQASIQHLAQTISFYTQITKNPWLDGDTAAYNENRIQQIPVENVKAVMLAVSERAGSRINSFAYFVKEILNSSDPCNRQFQKRSLARIVKRIRDIHVGAHNYGIADFVYDVKQACAREGVVFDNDLFNSLNT